MGNYDCKHCGKFLGNGGKRFMGKRRNAKKCTKRNSPPRTFARKKPSSSGSKHESCNIHPASQSPSGSINLLTSVVSSTQNTNQSINSLPCNHERSTSPVHSQVNTISTFYERINLHSQIIGIFNICIYVIYALL